MIQASPPRTRVHSCLGTPRDAGNKRRDASATHEPPINPQSASQRPPTRSSISNVGRRLRQRTALRCISHGSKTTDRGTSSTSAEPAPSAKRRRPTLKLSADVWARVRASSPCFRPPGRPSIDVPCRCPPRYTPPNPKLTEDRSKSIPRGEVRPRFQRWPSWAMLLPCLAACRPARPKPAEVDQLWPRNDPIRPSHAIVLSQFIDVGESGPLRGKIAMATWPEFRIRG